MGYSFNPFTGNFDRVGGISSATAPVSYDANTQTISISAATTSAAGSMSAADKTKLDGIAAGATANSSDATLLNRANHTGTQTSLTISDFTSAAAAAAPVQSVAGRTGAVTLSSSDISGLGTAATAASTDFLPTTFTADTITYAATVDLDMAALAGGYRTISLTGNLAFTTSNRASGRTVVIRLVCDSTQRTLTFPAGWVFVGAKPASIAASKTAVLSLTFFGTADTDCVAACGVQS